jgi:hypothetical protein
MIRGGRRDARKPVQERMQYASGGCVIIYDVFS